MHCRRACALLSRSPRTAYAAWRCPHCPHSASCYGLRPAAFIVMTCLLLPPCIAVVYALPLSGRVCWQTVLDRGLLALPDTLPIGAGRIFHHYYRGFCNKRAGRQHQFPAADLRQPAYAVREPAPSYARQLGEGMDAQADISPHFQPACHICALKAFLETTRRSGASHCRRVPPVVGHASTRALTSRVSAATICFLPLDEEHRHRTRHLSARTATDLAVDYRDALCGAR